MNTTKITSIAKVDSEDRYDLEVADNHNFFANDILVHNCRCVFTKDGNGSRKGKGFATVGHIESELAAFFAKYPGIILDGELYNHDLKDDFNAIISVVKKQKPDASDLGKAQRLVQYHVYDCFDPSRPGLSFAERSAFLAAELDRMMYVKVVKTWLCENVKGLDDVYAELLEAGFEGQMVRDPRSPYEPGKRSSFLLKRKEFEDAEFPVHSVEEGKGNRSGMAGRLNVTLPSGEVCGCGIKGGYDFYKELWTDRDNLPGKMVTVRFQNWTPDGKLRFPVAVAIRNYE